MEGIHIPVLVMQIKVWKDLRIYIQITWNTLFSKVCEERLSMAKAKRQMCQDYGIDDNVFMILDDRINIAYLPPN